MKAKVYEEDLDEEQTTTENWFDKELIRRKNEIPSLSTDLNKQDKILKEALIKSNRLIETADNQFIPGNIKNKSQLKKWANENQDLIVELSDRNKKVFKRGIQSWEKPNIILETAEDDRVIGIPHTMTTAGDKLYIINGKIMTGWSMYFSLTAIRSPEDYTRNVDLVYNVPYLYSSLLLKSQLGLGAGFEIVYGKKEDEIPEEKLIRHLFFDKLRINRRKLMKTAFHKYEYGNAYWHVKEDRNGFPEKITILQPERIKIFLDPMTTKILFYIYLPPIIGGTVLTPYPDIKHNPNLVHNLALTYPNPIVINPDNIIHFKQNDYTEYPFGFSDIKACLEVAQGRYDINLLAPIIFKKYAKPMVHWQYDTKIMEGRPKLKNNQIKARIDSMITLQQELEPASDTVTTDRWNAIVLNAPTGKQDLLILTQDLDTQIFGVNGVPETYFKPKGSTDRMIAEQDKTFMGRLKGDQEDFADEINDKIIKPIIDKAIKMDIATLSDDDKELDDMEKFLIRCDSFMKEIPRYPEIQWREIIKQDETQQIANTLAKLNAGIIDPKKAAKSLNEEPPEDNLDQELTQAMNQQMNESPYNDSGGGFDGESDNTMSNLKGGLNIQKGANSIKKGGVKDPSNLGL